MKINSATVAKTITAACLMSTLSCHLFAQESLWGQHSRGTLFHWGDGFTGGPDLNAPLVTDRPDFTEASSTVGWRVTQIELGYTYSFDNDGVDQTILNTFPEALTRRGIFANWLELRVLNSFTSEKLNGDDTTGRDDTQIGFKIGLTPQQRFLPEMALIPQMDIPTGSSETTSDEVLVGANWIYAWDLTDRFSIAGSSQFNRRVDDLDAKFTEFAQSIAIGVSMSERFGGYAEWFSIIPASDAVGSDDEHFFNGGFTFLINNDVQWDIRGGVGLNEDADEYFFGTGFSIRFH